MLFAQAGSLITRIEAVDDDSGLNSDLVYDIASGNDDSAFEIDRSTGIISVAAGGALARRVSRVHRMVVVVRDRGTPTLHAVADLIVAVNDSVVVLPLGGEVQRQSDLEATLAIAGGAAIGGALVILSIVLVAIIICCLRRRRSKRQRRREEAEKQRRSRYVDDPSINIKKQCTKYVSK